MNKTKKIGVAFSGGGHYLEALKACSLLLNSENYDIFYVTYKPSKPTDFGKRSYFVAHPEHGFILKRLFLLMVNFVNSFKVFLKERPDLIISTGADVTLSIMLIAKIFNKKLVFIESGANVTKPSLTGRLIYRFADVFIIQWEELKVIYPKAIVGINLL
ncbi:MAG: polysaccharide biosynthesis protein [Pedobacter sp.]|nr:MAG: polysaccharide biosynthesis protein [Pedobacter sp.]